MDVNHFGAIDIGTNAGRLLIGYAIPEGDHISIKKVSLTRVPLRLGEDVYSKSQLSEAKIDQLCNSLIAFKHLMAVYNVRDYRAVATSAMREAKNGQQVCDILFEQTGIKLEIIDGQEEANYLFSTFSTQNIDQNKDYLFIDVGGGSTELTIVKKGTRVESKSFRIGALRTLKQKQDVSVWEEVEEWVDNYCRNGKTYIGIGTGGNINRILKFNKKKHLEPLTYDEIRSTIDYISEFSTNERITRLRLKPDRADVIIPAGKIYLRVMEICRAEKIIVPKIGVSDGIIYSLYNRHFFK